MAKKILVGLGGVVAIIFFLEILAICFLNIFGYEFFFSNKIYNAAINSNVYPDSNKFRQILNEHMFINRRFSRFSHWRSDTFEGRRVNINSDGRRLVLASPDIKQDADLVIFSGASGIFGFGLADGDTIPDFFAKKLSNSKIRIENHGQNAYVFAQELLDLYNDLLQGKRPKLVIFYSGFNDAFSALYSMNKYSLRREEDLSRNFDRERRMISGEFRYSLAQYFENFRFFAIIQLAQYKLKSIAREFNFDSAGTVSQEFELAVVSNYLNHLDFLDFLSKKYEFDYHIFLPASIFDRNISGGNEFQLLNSTQEIYPHKVRALKNISRMLELRLKKRLGERFTSLRDIFAGEDRPVFMDLVHLGPLGADITAEKMLIELKRRKLIH
jgi:hypothetical protein